MLLKGFEPLSQARKARMIAHYTIGAKGRVPGFEPASTQSQCVMLDHSTNSATRHEKNLNLQSIMELVFKTNGIAHSQSWLNRG